jgi:hypothetical protein
MKFSQHILYIALAIVLVMGLAGISQPTSQVEAAGTPTVLAFYYGWFNGETWGSGQLSDRPAETYDSSDRGAMARHISQAQSAGINGFVMSWFGPDEPYTTGNLFGLLDLAGAQGFQVAADVDMSSTWMNTTESALNAMRHAMSSVVTHGAYLRYDGKPVIFFWNQNRFSAAQWREIRAQVDPDHTTIWIGEGASVPMPVFDGRHLYNVAWSRNPAGTNATWANRTKNAGGYFVATAMPGFDDSLMGRGDATVVRNRNNGDYFRQSFAGAAAANPHMIIITSWNEYFENSHIEPSQTHGTLYLDLARELIASYRATGTVPVSPSGGVTTQAPAVTSPTGVFAAPTVAALNVRQAPTVEAERITQVNSGNRYPLLGKNGDGTWWLIDYGGGQGWVFAEYTTVEGDLNAVPVVG